MGAKVIRHPRTGKPIQPKKDRATAGRRAAAGARGGAAQQRGRQNHRGYPDGRGPGGYAGAEGDETVVVCEAPASKKFPWGTVLLTGVVSTVGVIAAYKIYEKMTGERVRNPEPESNALLNARDYLLLSAPGAEHAISRMPQQPQIINAGASAREIELMERETKLRERMAEMEGFIQGQQAAAQQKDNLAALMEAMEDD